MRLVRVVVLLALLGALAFALYADSASAMTTWSGTCKYEGWSQFWPKRRWIPAPSGYHYQGTGTCKGTLNGQPYDGPSTVDNYADMHQPMGCAVGGSTYGGPVYMTFLTGPPPGTSATAPPKPTAPTKKAKKKRKARHRKKTARKRKRARRAAVRAASDPPHPPPSDQPTPAPAAPTSPYPVLAAWTDEINYAFYIASDLYGAYRGFGIGTGELQSAPDQPTKCVSEGLPGLVLKQDYTTVTELMG